MPNKQKEIITVEMYNRRQFLARMVGTAEEVGKFAYHWFQASATSARIFYRRPLPIDHWTLEAVQKLMDRKKAEVERQKAREKELTEQEWKEREAKEAELKYKHIIQDREDIWGS